MPVPVFIPPPIIVPAPIIIPGSGSDGGAGGDLPMWEALTMGGLLIVTLVILIWAIIYVLRN